MNSHDLTQQWVDKELDRYDIFKYLVENITGSTSRHDRETVENITGSTSRHDRETLDHVADLCYQIYQWSTGRAGDLGTFLDAIVNNNLSEAVMHADGKNRTALWLYVAFLYNVAPIGWRNKETSEEKAATEGGP